MKESQLAKKFINYFNNGYQVYSEVPAGGGPIDFVATDELINIGCEVKTSFGLKVMEQAFKKKAWFHYTYICVPFSKSNWNFRKMVIREHGIGLLVYRHEKIVERVKPKLNRQTLSLKLKDYMKESVAGSKNDRVTAFGNTINQIKRHLKTNGASHIDEILERIDHHYNTISTAKSSIRQWIKRGVIEDIEWDRAVLTLKD